MSEQHCIHCAVIACDCGAYHGTDGTVAVDAGERVLYRFAQTHEQIECGDEECDRVHQYALDDDDVSRLAHCEHCEAHQ